jgi:RNA polymerase sigma-70 factor (ECF subfamily)
MNEFKDAIILDSENHEGTPLDVPINQVSESAHPETIQFLVEFAWNIKEDLLRWAHSILCPYGLDAEDLVQDLFAKILSGRIKYENDNPKGWLVSVTRNLCIDKIRVTKTIPVAEVYGEEIVDYSNPPSTNSGLSYDVKDAITSLPPDQRTVIFLHFMAGKDAGEIAERIGRSNNSVHSLQHRGRVALRETLELHGLAPSARDIKTERQKRLQELRAQQTHIKAA